MRYPVTRIDSPMAPAAIVLLLLVFAHTALAGGDPDEFSSTEPLTEVTGDGATQDITDQAATEVPASVATPVATKATPITTTAPAAASAVTAAATTTPVVAAAEEETGNPLFRTIVDAMTPEAGVPALDNDRLSFYFSSQVVFAQYELSAARYDLERSRIHLGFMFTEERDTLFQTGLSIDSSLTSSFRLSFGTRAYIALLGDENNDAFAAAFGLEAAYQLPFERLPLEFAASLYFAPDVLTFGQGDRIIDLQLDVSVPFRSQLSLFTGIRFLQVDTRIGDEEIDNRIHFGLRWDFI